VPPSASPTDGTVASAQTGTMSAAGTAAVTGTTVLASGLSHAARVAAYPRNGQSPDQQARDQYECYRFGVAQTGYDPMVSTNSVVAAGRPGEADFQRAQAACFEGRGYTVR